MTKQNTELLASFSSETRSVFHSRGRSPQFIWNFDQTTSFKIIAAMKTISNPVTVRGSIITREMFFWLILSEKKLAF